MVLLAAALFLSPVQTYAEETFRGEVIEVDWEQEQMLVVPAEGMSGFPSSVLVQFPVENPPSGHCNKVLPQCIGKGKRISITGTFSVKQPELFIATTVSPTNIAHFKDRTGVRLRLGRCRLHK